MSKLWEIKNFGNKKISLEIELPILFVLHERLRYSKDEKE